MKTRGKTRSALADELWRYVLFSEFVFDLPVPLPDTLRGVPHAPMEARPIVEDVCDRLRSDPAADAGNSVGGAGTANRLPIMQVKTRGSHESVLRKADPGTAR